MDNSLIAYNDAHRTFLQGFMSKGILDYCDVIDLMKVALGKVGVKIPEEKETLNKAIVSFMQCINSKIEEINLQIVKWTDEDVIFRRKTFFVLVNRLDRSSDSSQLTRLINAQYELFELEFLKHVMEKIIASEEREIDETLAINLVREVKKKNMKTTEGELAVKKFANDNWLKIKNGKIRLASRFIAEMEPYLKEFYGDMLMTCTLCKKLVVRGIKCNYCQDEAFYHFCCSYNRIERILKCKTCGNEIPSSLVHESEQVSD